MPRKPAASSTLGANRADAVRAKFARAGQGQVFRFWEKLSATQKKTLLAQAGQIDLAEISRLVKTHLRDQPAAADFSRLRPAPHIARPENGGDAAAWARARTLGEKALRAGRVACFTVAGGQGTRLGFDGPKGAFPVTPVRGYSLFQVFAEKIRAAGARHGRDPHWFILTSQANHDSTTAFFRKHQFFGLKRRRVHFLPQGRMPAVDFAGKLLLEAPDRLALGPDGHGGALRAFVRHGGIETMRAAGADLLSYFHVDNPLVRCVDPAFIGFHLEAGSEMSSKMVPKRDAGEKVGHLCATGNGRLCVVEYSDMPPELCRERDASGELRFRAGSVGIHVFNRAFVARVGAGRHTSCRLPFHRANKKIPVTDDAGRRLQPAAPNGVKFEMFVFDALPLAKHAIVVETARAEEFSPVKNAAGEDSPQTCRDDQLRLFARWLRAAGVAVRVGPSGRPRFKLEISPLFGDDAASVAAAWAALKRKPRLAAGLVLQ